MWSITGRGITGPVTESGLANLRRRAQQSGGVFTVGNAAGGGTAVHGSAPLPQKRRSIAPSALPRRGESPPTAVAGTT